MLQREVQFDGNENCENCGESLDTNKGNTAWRESPSIVLLCDNCEDTYTANLQQDVLIIPRA